MAAQQRYEGLDHLRGLLAITIMLYHFSYWLGYEGQLPFFVARPLALLGLYAVSTFYCLSGAALFIVYRSRTVDRAFIREFTIKRAFRICPLFWAATTASLAVAGFAPFFEDSWRVMLSYTLLFSWLDPTAYFSTGAWSIGNEWAFYSLFPILLLAWKRSWSRIMVITGSLAVSCYYAFFIIDSSVTVADQWSSYISPLNQVLLFVGGMLMGSLILQRQAFRLSISILLGASLAFLAISYTFDRQYCIHGLLRLILIGICLAWCYGAGVFSHRSGKIGRALDWVGALSYSIYLLHPIVFGVTSRIVGKTFSLMPSFTFKVETQSMLTLVLAVVGTMIVSYISFSILEKPMMKAGKSLAMDKPKMPSQTDGDDASN